MQTTQSQQQARASLAVQSHIAKREAEARQSWAQRVQQSIRDSVLSAFGPKATIESRNREGMAAVMSHHAPGRIYAGTVSAKVIAKRRQRNKMARMSRRANRG